MQKKKSVAKSADNMVSQIYDVFVVKNSVSLLVLQI